MNILVIDDHPLFRDGMRVLLAGLDPSAQIHDAASVSKALTLVEGLPPFDLVLLDMNLPGTSHLAALASIKTAIEGASVVVISADEDPELILQTIEAGAAGYIPKTTDATITVHALRIVLAHGVYLPPAALRTGPSTTGKTPAATASAAPELSERQRAVLRSLLHGKANKLIARELGIAEGTVKAHLWSVYQALGVSSRVQAMCRVHELGMLGSLG